VGEVLSELSSGYYLERDPDVLVLRRDDASLAAAFSSRGAMPEAVWGSAEEAGHSRREASHRSVGGWAPRPVLGDTPARERTAASPCEAATAAMAEPTGPPGPSRVPRRP
jgi:hypothetical protein